MNYSDDQQKKTKIRYLSLLFLAVFLSTLFISCITGYAGDSISSTSREVDNEGSSPYQGYTLFNPQGSKTTYLIDNGGEIVHSWESDYRTGSSVYLLENGNLLRSATLRGEFGSAGGAGRIEEFTWKGELVWSFEYCNDKVLFHHDMEPLPNGNILLIAWERIDAEDALAAGRDPKLMPDSEEDKTLWMDHLIEVNREGEIVWEWHISDHLVQDFDADKDNYGVVADHPELININYIGNNRVSNDWNHVNAVDYNPELDQVMISVRNFSEIWVIDHSTTTAEAASEKGNILYRWGNPAAYDRGDESDQQLFGQHDAKWITEVLPGAGNILVFNNGDNSRPYSSVEDFTPPLNDNGEYELTESAYGPEAPVWHYQAPETGDFYSNHISGAQRLPNGNTLICSGGDAMIFEVTIEGEIVWEYHNPYEVTSPKGETKNSIFRAEKYSPDYEGLSRLNNTSNPVPALKPYEVTINGIKFKVTQPMYGWNELPDEVRYEREPVRSFTNSAGETHWYEVVYVPSMNLNWYQNAYLAQEAGGYIACITTEEENAFVFSLVTDEKYWWAFPEDGGHYGIKIGPNLGGYQPEGSVEPAGGWSWLSGEPWEYSNWARNLDDGVIDKDPRDNSQPNDSANGQPVMGFGELNVPVPTWGDYTGEKTTPRGDVRGAYAFIIEYENNPTK